MAEPKKLITVKNIIKTYKLGDVKVPALNGVSSKINQDDFLITLSYEENSVKGLRCL